MGVGIITGNSTRKIKQLKDSTKYWKGTKEELAIAIENGEIEEGTILHITNDYVTENGSNFTVSTHKRGSGITKNEETVKGWYSNTRVDVANKMAVLVLNVTLYEINHYTCDVLTLDENIRPPESVASNTITDDGHPCYVYIGADGKVGITLVSTSQTFAEDDGVRISIPYYTV